LKKEKNKIKNEVKPMSDTNWEEKKEFSFLEKIKKLEISKNKS
jgi:hypothetical protein